MKYAKIILWAALTLAASAAFAQTEANRNRLAEIEKMEVKAKKGGPKFDRFGIRLVPEIGYGAHLVKSEDFRSQGMDSGQAYLQALDVFYRPFVWGSVHVGAAIGMDWFKIRDMLFIQDDDHNVLVAPFPEEDKEKDTKYRSSVSAWTVTVPATLQFHSRRRISGNSRRAKGARSGTSATISWPRPLSGTSVSSESSGPPPSDGSPSRDRRCPPGRWASA